MLSATRNGATRSVSNSISCSLVTCGAERWLGLWESDRNRDRSEVTASRPRYRDLAVDKRHEKKLNEKWDKKDQSCAVRVGCLSWCVTRPWRLWGWGGGDILNFLPDSNLWGKSLTNFVGTFSKPARWNRLNFRAKPL